ncbi:hypothetical protein SAMN02910265_02603 [Ruminococcus flavefaciens]|uniref:Uncharacterized protein n=1 Tax=Ruminococcus flavefaciens TaxID=1265 RepID=A0A1H6KWF5_RUMFL|nr:hypothetical protein [Ruminococcus flavefaciens]SEH77267.1 hypothetical protein SAMN02910265_02603 [Ruminococcus flavefaciens]
MNTKTNKKKIVTLRTTHIATVIAAVVIIAGGLILGGWSDWIMWVCIAFTLICDGQSEKEDELVKENMAKATKFSFWALIGALVYFGLKARYHAISATAFLVVILGAVALRSLLFLIFDMTPKAAEEE